MKAVTCKNCGKTHTSTSSRDRCRDKFRNMRKVGKNDEKTNQTHSDVVQTDNGQQKFTISNPNPEQFK